MADVTGLVSQIPQFGLPRENGSALVEQAAPILGAWGETLNQTRELDPVLLGTDASGKSVLLDRAIYVEEASGERVANVMPPSHRRPRMWRGRHADARGPNGAAKRQIRRLTILTFSCGTRVLRSA